MCVGENPCEKSRLIEVKLEMVGKTSKSVVKFRGENDEAQ